MIDRLLHLTDFHFWEVVFNPFRFMNKRIIGNVNVFMKRRHEFFMDRAEAYADYAGTLNAPDALLTGDFTSTATPREFEMARQFILRLEHNSIKPVAIPGNHDVYTFESVRKKQFQKFLEPWIPEKPLPCLIELRGGTPVLFVPTVRPNIVSSQGYVGPKTIRDVAALLKELDRPVIVAAHYPLIHKTGNYVAPAGRRLLNADALRNAIGKHPHPILYLAGHNHRFHLERDSQYEQLTHLCTASLLWQDERSGTKGEFCELNIDEGRVQVVRHICRDEWEAEPQDAVLF